MRPKLGYGWSRPPHEGRARGVGRGRRMRSLAGWGLARPKPQRSRDRRDRRQTGSGRPRSCSSEPRPRRIGPPARPVRGGATGRLKPRGGGDGTGPFVAPRRSARPGSLQEPCAGWLWPPARGGPPARALRAPPGPRSQSRPALPQLLLNKARTSRQPLAPLRGGNARAQLNEIQEGADSKGGRPSMNLSRASATCFGWVSRIMWEPSMTTTVASGRRFRNRRA